MSKNWCEIQSIGYCMLSSAEDHIYERKHYEDCKYARFRNRMPLCDHLGIYNSKCYCREANMQAMKKEI